MNKVFISYSHKDEAWKDRLVTHLNVLAKQGMLEIWDDRKINAGDDWKPQIEQAIESSGVAVMLISADFLTSDFILNEEVPKLLELRQKKGMKVIPLIVRPCDWTEVAWLGKIQARPVDGRPLSGGNENQIETDLTALTKEINKIINHSIGTGSSGKPLSAPPLNIPISLEKLPVTTTPLIGRDKELVQLDTAWADPHTNILCFVALGGVGKSALVNEWLNRMDAENFRGAERVYGWSFYSQGTREDRQVSADSFLKDALTWFDDEACALSNKSSFDKGRRLAELIREKRTLLILDGLEPMQYPPGEMGGRLKDQGMQALCKNIIHGNPGLCIITTRFEVEDLKQHQGKGKAGKCVHLDFLSEEAGAQLLVNAGVKGPHKELCAASREYSGHALALNLLGSFLAAVHEGDIRKRDLIPHLTDDEAHGNHAKRVMHSYELWLEGTPEKDILLLMGLFDRPAELEAIAVLQKEPVIKGLTDKLKGLSEQNWRFALKRIRELHLLSTKDDAHADRLDCHPLVREYFGAKLEKGNPGSWKEAHGRLYEYFRDKPEKKLPDTLDEMEPLFEAVAHGCKAGRVQEAMDEVYWERIKRKTEHYCTQKLGAFGSDLAALSTFFETPWSTPSSGLSDEAKAFAMNCAGFSLRALNRMFEAAEPMKAGMELQITQKDWSNVAVAASNLSALYLTLGDIAPAISYARRSVEFADKSGDGFERESDRTTLADALHQSGAMEDAYVLFQEAEQMQGVRTPDYRFLYSLYGYRFCDLLLSWGEYAGVRERTEETIQIAKQQHWLQDIALDHLSLGRASMLLAIEQHGDLASASDYLDRAVDGLREAGTQHMLPRGLLARAALSRLQTNFPQAHTDLNETFDIATQGGQLLHLTDYHLESARLALAEGERSKAADHLTSAQDLIAKTGYHRRDGELAALAGQCG